LAYQRDRIASPRYDEPAGAAHHFAGNNHDLTPAGLFFGQPAVFV
jgi:hypothetical protein